MEHPMMASADPATIFKPPVMLRSGRLQTVLASFGWRRYNKCALLAAAVDKEISTVDGVRLSGAYSAAGNGRARALVILLHGWEGSIDSTYVLSAGDFLFRHGLDVFRLNLRDHGRTHHLNRGLFYATLIEETHAAVMQAAALAGGAPVFLCGFSLGGNFALRVARRFSEAPDPRIDLRQVVAVSPALDPSRSTDAIDAQPLLRRYFVRKWQRSLRTKQRCFPELYDFSDIAGLGGIRRITETLLARYSTYDSVEEYFSEYNLCGRALAAVRVPTTIVTAADDPIIPVDDFSNLALSRSVRLIIHRYGGHSGFVADWVGNRWHEQYLLQLVTRAADRSAGRAPGEPGAVQTDRAGGCSGMHSAQSRQSCRFLDGH